MRPAVSRATVPLSVALLVAVVAAIGGGATAAKLVTGKQVKNNSVSTAYQAP